MRAIFDGWDRGVRYLKLLIPLQGTRMDQEAELVEQALGGDTAAVEQLLLSYYTRLSNYLSSHIPPKMSSYLHAEDILQQAYLKAFRSLSSFEPRSEHSFYGWVKTIAHRQLIDEVRRFEKDPMGTTAKRRAPRPGGSGSSTMIGVSQFLEDGDFLPDEEANRQELIRATQVALAALDPHYQQAIQLRYLQNLSADEVAVEMNVSPDALRGILFRARQKLKEEIGRLSTYV